jgi:valyl-tRNA synthetase
VAEIPKKYKHLEVEDRWRQKWDGWKIYAWDPSRPREETFVVDTPPPTVSGSLHVGHVFSYTHEDLLVRYQRMIGKNIAFPMGWDDNGLPTERRVQNLLGIRCNPRLPYDPDWQPDLSGGKGDEIEEVSRRNFIEACGLVTAEDEKAFEHLWRHLGLSLDWSEQYATIDDHCRKISQLSFLDLVEKGQVYNLESPNMWDIDFNTAVAQAEVEDRPRKGFFHDLRFGVEGGGELLIATTRPELLGACIAVVAHPDDERYQELFGKNAITPLYGARVPIVAAEHAEPDKGTGILMVCTFGDAMDVEWWKASGLPVKQLIGRDGRILPATMGEAPYESVDVELAQSSHDEITGQTVGMAKKRIAELLAREGSLPAVVHPDHGAQGGPDRAGQQDPVAPVPHEDPLHGLGRGPQSGLVHLASAPLRGTLPGLVSGGLGRRARLLEPGLRRRGFAARRSADRYRTGIHRRPAGPAWWLCRRPRRDGHLGDLVAEMDIRPQAHDIIRTWAFSTIVKAWMHEGEIPWYHVVLSGWILDPDRKKMSKSKGNVVTPDDLLVEWSSDAVRYWAARARLGTDTAFDPGVFKVGKRLATKIFNASRFVLMQLERGGGEVPGVENIAEPLDLALIERRLRLRVRSAGHRGELLAVLRPLPRAGQAPFVRRGRHAGPAVGAGRAGSGAQHLPAPARTIHAVCDRGGVVLELRRRREGEERPHLGVADACGVRGRPEARG